MSQEHSFDYEYSARQQAEVRKIRAKYLPEHADTLETLRRLDAHAEKKGSTYSLIIGISGLMILGGGMSLIMVGNLIALGVVTGIAGLALLSAAYPIYQHITKAERKRIAPEIIRLTEQLLDRK